MSDRDRFNEWLHEAEEWLQNMHRHPRSPEREQLQRRIVQVVDAYRVKANRLRNVEDRVSRFDMRGAVPPATYLRACEERDGLRTERDQVTLDWHNLNRLLIEARGQADAARENFGTVIRRRGRDDVGFEELAELEGKLEAREGELDAKRGIISGLEATNRDLVRKVDARERKIRSLEARHERNRGAYMRMQDEVRQLRRRVNPMKFGGEDVRQTLGMSDVMHMGQKHNGEKMGQIAATDPTYVVRLENEHSTLRPSAAVLQTAMDVISGARRRQRDKNAQLAAGYGGHEVAMTFLDEAAPVPDSAWGSRAEIRRTVDQVRGRARFPIDVYRVGPDGTKHPF